MNKRDHHDKTPILFTNYIPDNGFFNGHTLALPVVVDMGYLIYYLRFCDSSIIFIDMEQYKIYRPKTWKVTGKKYNRLRL